MGEICCFFVRCDTFWALFIAWKFLVRNIAPCSGYNWSWWTQGEEWSNCTDNMACTKLQYCAKKISFLPICNRFARIIDCKVRCNHEIQYILSCKWEDCHLVNMRLTKWLEFCKLLYNVKPLKFKRRLIFMSEGLSDEIRVYGDLGRRAVT